MTSETRTFEAFVPLSNWLKGYDRYRQVFDKTSLPSSTYPGVFYVLDIQGPHEHRAFALAKTRSLIQRLGVPGDRLVRLEARLPIGSDPSSHAAPNTFTGTGMGWRWPSSCLPITAHGWVNEDDSTTPAPHETITAAAFALPNLALNDWADCVPRTFSVLPIAQACNANCAFCFSKASMSDAIVPDKLDLAAIAHWSARAREAGAERAVITGGGEPTLLPLAVMASLLDTLRADFKSILLITNGARLVQDAQRHGEEHAVTLLRAWKEAGLSRLALSRHGTTAEQDASLMGLAVPGHRVMSLCQAAGLPTRQIAVIQKKGVAQPADVEAYLRRSASEGNAQVCFKELYVSALSENPWANSKENQYAQKHQVPLSMVIDTLATLGFTLSHRLPWGSPVYQGIIDNQVMQVAAYTEPSVGWERTHGVVRSWNWMINGECLASLEDPASRLPAPRITPVCRKAIPVALHV
jgi:hypothetical protein